MRPITFISALLAALLLPASHAFAYGDWDWPVRGQVVTQFRNGDDPYAAGQHRGIDIAAPLGTPVVAATAGTVAYAGVVGSSGLLVAERSGDGRYEVSYLHLSSVAVRRGEVVAAGDALGAVGLSGAGSVEQPHLHFGVREAADRHAYLDPLRFLTPPPTDAPSPRTVPVPVADPVEAQPLPAVAAGVAVAAPAPSAAPVLAPAPAIVRVPGANSAPAHARASGVDPSARVAPSGAHGHVTGRPDLGHAPRRGVAADPAPPARRPHPGPVRGGGRVVTPEHGPTTALRGGREPAAPAVHRAHAQRGFDAGWLAACLGLVAAAVLLAGPGGGRRKRPSGRAVFAQLVRAGSRG